MMTNRREILCGAAGALTALAAVGCGLPSPAFAQAPQRRREVVVNGKRVRTVDLHAHCHVPEADALMGLKVPLGSLVVSPERIEAMDQQGIDIEALSLNPIFWYKAEPDLAGQVVKLQNEKLAEICAAQPDRFVGLASVALQHPDLAAAQLEDAVLDLKLSQPAELGHLPRTRHGAFFARVLSGSGGLDAALHGTSVPVEEPSTASKAAPGPCRRQCPVCPKAEMVGRFMSTRPGLA